MALPEGGGAGGVTVHQTVRSLQLTPQQEAWRYSWRELGFQLATADDAMARRDVERLVAQTGSADLLKVYDALETNVQRSDFWRYAVLWLDGGVYADVDVYALPPIVPLVLGSAEGVIFSESLPIFERIPLPLSALIGGLALRLGLTDLVRLPQRRNCVMVAPPRHPLMMRTLQLIVAKFQAERDAPPLPEPTRTLELTGPGILTDALDELLREQGQGALGLRFVSRSEGARYFGHAGQGSWKTYLGGIARAELRPHERRLRWFVALVTALALALYWLRGVRCCALHEQACSLYIIPYT